MTDSGQISKQLLDYVRALENRTSYQRGEQVLAELTDMGFEPVIQTCRLTQSRNIIVDFRNDPLDRYLLFSAHYDVVKDSPGANDDASGVAVLLGLCKELQHTHKSVKIVFFDREESWLRILFLSLGLLGSLSYVYTTDLRPIQAVYNLEFCGRGDSVAVWPVKEKEMQLEAVRKVEKAASGLGVQFRAAHVPWLFYSSDHLSFRLRGLANAVTLSLLPSSQISSFESLLDSLNLIKLLAGRRPELPDPLKYIHSSEDSSSKLSESSLKLMLEIILELLRTSQV